MQIPTTIRARWLRPACWTIAVASLIVFGIATANGPGPHPGLLDYVGTAASGVIFALAFLRGARLRIEVDQSGITIFNFWKTRVVQWDEIAECRADYYGIKILQADGTTTTASAIGKPNWSKWLHRSTRADEVAAWLQAEANRRRT